MREMEIDMTDPHRPVLWVRGQEIKRYGWNKAKARELIRDCGFYGRKKATAKAFFKAYGVTAANAAKFLNNGLIKMSVGDLKGHEPLCYRGKRFCTTDTINACAVKDELDQAVEDGIRNITPLIAKLGKNPKELKDFFGNSTWKTLVKNSFTRNKLICDRLTPADLVDGESIKQIIDIPSGILKYEGLARDFKTMEYLNRVRGYSIQSLRKANSAGNTHIWDDIVLVRDTRRMAGQQEQPFSYNWSFRRMGEAHNHYSREVTRTYAARQIARDPEKYKKVLREGQRKIWGYDGVTATFLDTYESIVEEGARMRHCVGGYAGYCYDGCYRVFHISGDGEESTLGISMNTSANGNTVYNFSQHYATFNRPVLSEKHKTLAQIVIDDLNIEGSCFVTIKSTVNQEKQRELGFRGIDCDLIIFEDLE